MGGFRTFITGKKESLETGRGCAGEVQGRTIANVKNFGRLQVKLLSGLLEDGWRRFASASFAGDDDSVEVMVEIEVMEKRAEAFVPIGNDGELEIAGAEELQGREHVVEDVPCVGSREVIV